MANQDYWDNLWRESPLLEGEVGQQHDEYLCPEIARCLQRYCPARVKLLEAGCGLGVFNFWLENQPAVALSLGVDISNSLWRAQAFKKERALRSNFVRGDIGCLPFAADSFDFIVNLGVIEHFPRPQALLTELRRVSAPGGVLFIDTPNKSLWSLFTRFFPLGEHEDYYRPAELAALVREAGFEVLQAYSKGFSNTVLTPLYTLYGYDRNSLLSRGYYALLHGLKFLLRFFDAWLDGLGWGFYSIVIARKSGGNIK